MQMTVALDKYEPDCAFCTEFAHIDRQPNRKIMTFRNQFILLPTLGCFREGYCLYMPIKHERSFASLGEQRLARIGLEIEYIRQTVVDEFLTPVIVAEHGPGIGDKSANSCDHAHMHIIPVDNIDQVLSEFYKQGGPPQQLTKFSDIEQYKTSAYIYLSYEAGQHLVWRNVTLFKRQFVRRVCAGLDGLGEKFDWQLYPFYENMLQTMRVLRKRFQREVVHAS